MKAIGYMRESVLRFRDLLILILIINSIVDL